MLRFEAMFLRCSFATLDLYTRVSSCSYICVVGRGV